MAQQYQQDVYDFPSNRSPGRGYNGGGLTLNRQPSRHFNNNVYDAGAGGQLQGLYTAEDHAQYNTSRSTFDRMNVPSTMHSNYAPAAYDNQTWNYGGANGGAHTMGGGTNRMKHSSRRAGIPGTWMEPLQPQMPQNMNSFHQQMNGQHENNHQTRAPSNNEEGKPEDLIPTAIVIKNIPFAVKKEQLISIMTDLNLPLPYAFNYHFDNGVFRGLAFANFTTCDETHIVINAMNAMDILGRKLRVEYKKMLPAEERERIERDKRERRGQLEEQHRPQQSLTGGMAAPNQQGMMHQSSMTSLTSNRPPTSPSPVSTRGNITKDYDLNDPITLIYYNDLMIFKSDSTREVLVFPSSVPPLDRKTIHTLAHFMGLEHKSEGSGESRCVTIYKTRQTISPPAPQLPYYNESRGGNHQLMRAATVDFNEMRDAGGYRSLARQGSGLLDIPGSPGLGGLNAAHQLRAAKSFADLRSYTPSPVPTSASFPANLAQNVSRYTNYEQSSAASGTPNLTPTSAERMNNREEQFLSNGMNNMGLGFDRPNQQRNNNGGRIGQERENHSTSAGPIGSQRPLNGNSNGNSYDEKPVREPRGPGSEWGNGFGRPRQNGHVNRGSGELDRNPFETGWDDNRV